MHCARCSIRFTKIKDARKDAAKALLDAAPLLTTAAPALGGDAAQGIWEASAPTGHEARSAIHCPWGMHDKRPFVICGTPVAPGRRRSGPGKKRKKLSSLNSIPSKKCAEPVSGGFRAARRTARERRLFTLAHRHQRSADLRFDLRGAQLALRQRDGETAMRPPPTARISAGTKFVR
jgi:hypothetical protein